MVFILLWYLLYNIFVYIINYVCKRFLIILFYNYFKIYVDFGDVIKLLICICDKIYIFLKWSKIVI